MESVDAVNAGSGVYRDEILGARAGVSGAMETASRPRCCHSTVLLRQPSAARRFPMFSLRPRRTTPAETE